MTLSDGTHRCPAGPCPAIVPDHMLACRDHWLMLPREVRDAVYRTRDLGLLHRARRGALLAATAFWREALRP